MTTKNTLLVVADLACFKAYKIDGSETHSSPRLQLIEDYDNPDAHEKLVDKVSDLSGRFPRGKGGGAMSDGERHNIELESRKRFVRQLAQKLNRLAKENGFERCFLAASKEINHQLLEELDPQVRAKLVKTVSADLTKIDKSQLLSHF
jgi:protein required for attachment to host cells